MRLSYTIKARHKASFNCIKYFVFRRVLSDNPDAR